MTEQLAKRATTQWVSQVLEQFNKHTITEKEACNLLDIKRIQLYELRRRWLKAALKGIPFELHASGENKKRSLTKEVQNFLHKELSYIKEKAYHYRNKFNFAFLSEKVQKEFNVFIHRNTIRRFAIKEGYYEQTAKEKQKPCIRFEMDSVGALFQHDTSHHIWLPSSKRYHDLIMTKDDHSRRTVAFGIREAESAWFHLCLARQTFETIGLPLAYYVDKHSIFKFNLSDECIHYTRRISEEEGKVQFKRALNSLDITALYAEEAKSKGKIEKSFDYFQRRLPQECERYRVKTVKEAMKILADLVHFYNTKRVHMETGEIPLERWNRAIKEGRCKLRPIPENTDLDAIFSLHFQRTVYNDGTFKFQGKIYKLGQFPGRKITVAVIPGRKLMAFKDNQKIWQYHLPDTVDYSHIHTVNKERKRTKKKEKLLLPMYTFYVPRHSLLKVT